MRLKYTLVFLLGFVSCALLFSLFSYFGVALAGVPIEMGKVPFGTGMVSYGVSAPSDWVSEDDIVVFDDMVVLRIANATLSNYANSGSMLPFLDEGANGIRVVPESVDDVNVGDIVSYVFDGIMIVHRVVEKGVDDEGVYFVMQGDNNLVSDGKVRFEDVRYVTVGILY
ncbi:hypothetical protein HN935_02230 [archaeon]|nr:hypothetical protein [archaeon]